jgi:hypothetical protein
MGRWGEGGEEERISIPIGNEREAQVPANAQHRL